MNKDQIEEMAMSIAECNGTTCDNCALKCKAYITCEILYDKDYRKVPENAVILTREERDEEMKEIARLNRVETELQELYIKYYNEAKDLRREVAELKAENEKKLKANEDFATKHSISYKYVDRYFASVDKEDWDGYDKIRHYSVGKVQFPEEQVPDANMYNNDLTYFINYNDAQICCDALNERGEKVYGK